MTDLDSIADALTALRAGRPVIVVDDEDRENEGDLIIAAEHMTTEMCAFFLEHTSGFICTATTAERMEQLAIPMMVEENTESFKTAFAVTVDFRRDTTTGISAADRAATVRALTDRTTAPADLARPGHMHVLRARAGGVLKRAGHTEAAVDLMNLAGLFPAGAICEVVTENKQEMARLPELIVLARNHDLPIISIAQLIAHRRQNESIVTAGKSVVLPTDFGDFRCRTYRSSIDGANHLALTMGEMNQANGVLVRVHSECLTGDIFSSQRCDCGNQLRDSMKAIAAEGAGAIVYLRGQEGRGIGLAHKLEAYQLQEQGYDTIEANIALGLPVDSREYGIGAQILADLGVTKMRLLTNNPDKRSGLSGFGLEIVDRVGLPTTLNRHNVAYLRTKRDRLGHLFEEFDDNQV